MHINSRPGPHFGLISTNQQKKLDDIGLPKHWAEMLIQRYGDNEQLAFGYQEFTSHNLSVKEELEAQKDDEYRNEAITTWFRYSYKVFGDIVYDNKLIAKHFGHEYNPVKTERDLIKQALQNHGRLDVIRSLENFTPSDRAFEGVHNALRGIKDYLFPDFFTVPPQNEPS